MIKKEEIIKSCKRGGFTYEVIKRTIILYPSIRHATHDIEGKTKYVYICRAYSTERKRETFYETVKYKWAISWFKDKEEYAT